MKTHELDSSAEGGSPHQVVRCAECGFRFDAKVTSLETWEDYWTSHSRSGRICEECKTGLIHYGLLRASSDTEMSYRDKEK